jgi:hypothetical protein
MLPAIGNKGAALFDANTVRAIMGTQAFSEGTSAINNIEFTSGSWKRHTSPTKY